MLPFVAIRSNLDSGTIGNPHSCVGFLYNCIMNNIHNE